jgi:two-component system sensor histidine kinase KdpD
VNDARPNPDELLRQVQAEEARRNRGKLKVFFGAAAGVGKTYAMLEAARARRAEGLDVIVGIVETHGRRETEALLAGLEIVPPRFVEYRGTKLREFDLDAVLARKPAIVLVDELAHTNAPGSRNPKRWQDIQALLDAGINVYTTLNVQHLESLNDVIAQITGVEVRETLPDSVVEQADEIELVDLPPDDLLQRLKEGKVYVPEQAGLAAEHFFRKGNLIALRELAMRVAAARVDQQARAYRQEQAITRTWPATERLLVCVTSSPLSARLVRAARRMATGLHVEWTAANVEQPGLSEADRTRLTENLGLAQQLGADVVTLSGDGAVEEIVNYARKHNVTRIIAGKPGRLRWRERLHGSFVANLIRASGDIDVYVIKGEDEPGVVTHAVAAEVPTRWASYGWAILAVLASTGVALAMHPFFALPNLIMVYLLGVMVIAARFGQGPAVLSAILSVAAFDFCFVPPPLTLAVSDSQYVVTFAVMLTVALFIGSMTAQLRRQAKAAFERERRTAALFAMSGHLSRARGTDELLDVVVRHVAELVESDIALLLPDADGHLRVAAGNETTFPMDARERGVVYWVYDLGRPAGLGTDTLPSAEGLYLPLNGTRGGLGVLAVRPTRASRGLTPELVQLLETLAVQAGLAIEGYQLAEEVRKAQVQAETEKSRNALLSSVSHDLRTPLSAITGAASTLLEHGDALDPAARRELAETIAEETAHMSRLVANLLEMTKLQSGAAKVRKELCPVEDVVGSALVYLDKQLARHRVTARLPADLPAVPLDSLLMEQVFVNLLENAAKYAPPGSEIEVSAASDDREVTVEVADRGPGITPGDEHRIFDKFYRGTQAGSTAGVGLGLTICRAVIEAHGGRIWVQNRDGGGAAFRFTLPLNGTHADTAAVPPQEPS